MEGLSLYIGVGGQGARRHHTGIERPGARSGVLQIRLSSVRNGTPILALVFGQKCHILLQMRASFPPTSRRRACFCANCCFCEFVCYEISNLHPTVFL